MIILALETSCDETSLAILKNQKVLGQLTFSQVYQQKKYGGVVPDLAAQLHLKKLKKILKKTLLVAQISLREIDYVAYTQNPGLIICLQIGQAAAETLALYLNKPLLACNHLEGHIYASLLTTKRQWKFPALALVVSGGHTQIYYLKKHLDFELWGETLDDAVGECLDKVALLLGYSYPGGPIIEKLALKGKNTYSLPLAQVGGFNLSFSGLKTAVRRIIEQEKQQLRVNDLAYSLQNILAQTLTEKLKKAWEKKTINSLILGGGVMANLYLTSYIKKFLAKAGKKIEVFLTSKKYCTDNASMIGILAYYQLKKRLKPALIV